MAAVGRSPPIMSINFDRKNPRKCFGSYARGWADLPGTTRAARIPRPAFFQAGGLSPDICPCGWADYWLTYITFISHLLRIEAELEALQPAPVEAKVRQLRRAITAAG